MTARREFLKVGAAAAVGTALLEGPPKGEPYQGGTSKLGDEA